MNWNSVKDRWPNAAHSRFVDAAPHRWFLQEMGMGPTIILLHGAGGSSHSWRDILPLLAKQYHVITIDFPGQGFTSLGDRNRCGLDSISADITALLDSLSVTPFALIGHSAGAAVAFRLALDWPAVTPKTKLVSINGALSHFKGLAGVLFPMMAKMLAQAPFVPGLFAKTANADRLITGTGSKIDPEGLAQYRMLISDRAHVDATLAMMSQWTLDQLLVDLPRLPQETLFMAGAGDLAVPPETSEKWARRMQNARYQNWNGHGHLMHEEAPEKVTEAITEFLAASA